MVYDVEFYKNNLAYDSETNSSPGAIGKKEKDSEHVTQSTNQSSNNQSTNQTTSSSSQQISQEKAKSIAKKHAGVSSVTNEKMEKDFDDGIYEYEYEFVSGNYKYEYKINASNGSVMKHEKEYVGQARISANDAKKKAFSHAGVQESQVYDLDVELDDGRYEVSFDSGQYEYEYEINAENGNIISFEKDYD